MNMIGGALYLAELARQFGFPGAYSAYNAGPGRYQRYVRRGVPLPSETVAYTAQITGGSPMPARSVVAADKPTRSEEHTSELQSLMRISYAVFCLKKKKKQKHRDRT